MNRTWQRPLWVGVLGAMLVMALGMPAAAADQGTIRLEPTTLSLVEGQDGTLKATVSEGLKGCTLDWSSKEEAVATVKPAVVAGEDGSAACTVKAVKAGETTITVTAQQGGRAAVTASCQVKVTAPPASVTGVDIVMPAGQNIVEVGGTLQLTAVVTPSDAANKAVTWSSKDPDVAAVDKDGRVSGVAPGRRPLLRLRQRQPV